MASLYDLELQESNNFIHALMYNGDTPALKLMLEQKTMAANMGEAGAEMLKMIDDPNSDIGKSVARLQQMKLDIQEAMGKVTLTPDTANQANTVFSKSPDSLTSLNEQERKIIDEYWLKKKAIIVLLLQKGYTHQELFS